MANHLSKYHEWGLCEGMIDHPTKIDPLREELVAAMHRQALVLTSIDGMQLALTAQVGHYQGDGFNIPAGLLRYTTNGDLNLNGEHISFVFERDTCKLLGMTRMQKKLAAGALLTPQVALTVMIRFLQQHAPDLIPAEVKALDIDKQIKGHRADFESKPIALGNTELQWIDDHPEMINDLAGAISIHGQKVKMYLPNTRLWAWGIVGNDGSVITFERDIFWNFAAFQRETQMWLHDAWLRAHQIFA